MRSVPDGHHISDKVFQLLEPLLPGPKDVWGRIAKNNRPFITELFWIFSTGAAWPDLAERYGDGAIPSVDLLGGEIRVVNDRDKFDQSYPHASAAVKENQKMSRTKGSSTQNYIWP